MRFFATSALLICLSLPCGGQAAKATRAAHQHVQERDVRAEMEFLASDALQGRGSGTQFELIAGTYLASRLREFGIQPAGDPEPGGKPGYIQTANLVKQNFTSAPVLSAGKSQWTHGKEVAVWYAASPEWKAPLQKLRAGDAVKPGAAVLVHLSQGKDAPPLRSQVGALMQQGAAALLLADSPESRKAFGSASAKLPGLPIAEKSRASSPMSGGANVVLLGADATSEMEAMAEGTEVAFTGEVEESPSLTWNVVGVIHGTGNATSRNQALLLGAHMDHLGTDPKLQGDQIYNGADDDASGAIAVMELARILGESPKPKRDVYFVFFGSEEKGGLGSQYFLDHSPVPIEKILAELEFEMIGRPDNKVPAKTLWLTGYDRSNLGAELAAHGAHLVADPHPEENFFTRSDNYALAKRGVVAHTVSSFGLHKDYHQPSDDIAHIDFTHLTNSIDSMVKPVEWLANSDFIPKWNPGKKP